MIIVDINSPARCVDCPMSYWIQSGAFEGLLMCSALEYKDHSGAPASEYIQDANANTRPGNCPIVNDMLFPNYCPNCGHTLRIRMEDENSVQ